MGQLIDWVVVFAVLLIGGALGYAFRELRLQHTLLERRKIPRQWPLRSRALANREERLVWKWLSRAFFDHHVMIKTPVTRFTLPTDSADSRRWFDLLSNVYCTFTVCDSEGRVVGCIDVPGPAGLSKSNRILKYSLLNQCNVGYMVVRSSRLPTLTQARIEFLGESAYATSDSKRDEAAMSSAKQSLQAALSRQREVRAHGGSEFGAMSTFSGHPSDDEDASNWGADSFVTPLDSRKAELR